MCLATTPETIEHILLDCPSFFILRFRLFFHLGIERFDAAQAATLLLGGELMDDESEGPLFNNGEPISNVTIDFLQSIHGIRQQVLRGLLAAWPPRVNAQLGTTVLPQGTEQEVQPGAPAPQGVLVGRNPTYLELGSDL